MQQIGMQAGRHHCSSRPRQSRTRPPQPHTAQLIQSTKYQRRCDVVASSRASVTADVAASKAAAATMTVHFRDEDVSTIAAAGDDLVEVAAGCGVTIPTGCWQGNCGVCEVEVYKYTGDAEADTSAATSPAVVRACITKLPPGYSRVEVAQMQDAIWGLDGYDT